MELAILLTLALIAAAPVAAAVIIDRFYDRKLPPGAILRPAAKHAVREPGHEFKWPEGSNIKPLRQPPKAGR